MEAAEGRGPAGPELPYACGGVGRNLFGRRAGMAAGPGGGRGAPWPQRGQGYRRLRGAEWAYSAPAALTRRGAEAALGRRDAARKGFTARDGQGKLGPRPARAPQSARHQHPARRSSRARERMVRRVRREESRSGRRSREPGARRAACARARRPSTRISCARAGGRAGATASGVTSRAVSEGSAIPSRGVPSQAHRLHAVKRKRSRLVTKVDQS